MSGAPAESACHVPGVQDVPSRSRRTSRHGFRRKHNPCRVRYVYEPRQEVFVFCWLLLTYPVMVFHISGLQSVSSVDRECMTTLVAYSPRYSDTNAVTLMPLCRGATHHRWPPDVCGCFTSGCVPSVFVCCSYVVVCAKVMQTWFSSVCEGDANMVQGACLVRIFCYVFCLRVLNSWLCGLLCAEVAQANINSWLDGSGRNLR
jgi:hypothetical protein